MKLKNIFFLSTLISLSLSQVTIQVSQMSNIASGKLLKQPFPIDHDDNLTEDYKIIENLFDVSITRNNLYLYTQLEYSDPPVFGVTRSNINNIISSYYLEYLNNKISWKIGDIYSTYSRGLIYNTYQSQDTDFDNSLQGLEIIYNLSDDIKLYSIMGEDEYGFRTRPDNQLNDLSLNHNSIFTGLQATSDNAEFNLQYMNQELVLDENVTTPGGQNPLEYFGSLSTTLGSYIGENLSGFSSDEISKYKIDSDMMGISFETYVFGVDIYTEYVLNSYSKLEPVRAMGEKINGSQMYSSLYFDLFNAGITYEFKRYDMPYFIPTISSAPIVYKEGTSNLLSRVSHNMNFVNEIGHQFDINYSFNDNVFLNMNLSVARKIHPMDGLYSTMNISYDYASFNENPTNIELINNYWAEETELDFYSYDSPDLMSIVFMDKAEDIFSFSPYRQFYMGVSGYLFNDKLSFNIGYDIFEHILSWGSQGTSGMTWMTHDFSSSFNHNIDSSMTSGLDTFSDDYWDELETDYYNEYYTLIYYNYPEEEAHEEAASGIGIKYSLNDYATFDEIQSVYEEEVWDSLLNFIDVSSDNDYYKWHYTSEKSITIPTYFSWAVGNGDSFSLYLDHQWREKKANQDKTYLSGETDENSSSLSEDTEIYISLSYKNRKDWTITLVYNSDYYTKTYYSSGVKNTKEKDENWMGMYFTVDMHSDSESGIIKKTLLGNSRVSLFYGSQRGGLVCANGVCAQQPEFTDGIKLIYERMF